MPYLALDQVLAQDPLEWRGPLPALLLLLLRPALQAGCLRCCSEGVLHTQSSLSRLNVVRSIAPCKHLHAALQGLLCMCHVPSTPGSHAGQKICWQRALRTLRFQAGCNGAHQILIIVLPLRAPARRRVCMLLI